MREKAVNSERMTNKWYQSLLSKLISIGVMLVKPQKYFFIQKMGACKVTPQQGNFFVQVAREPIVGCLKSISDHRLSMIDD